jgi:hypothetical protein
VDEAGVRAAAAAAACERHDERGDERQHAGAERPRRSAPEEAAPALPTDQGDAHLS